MREYPNKVGETPTKFGYLQKVNKKMNIEEEQKQQEEIIKDLKTAINVIYYILQKLQEDDMGSSNSGSGSVD